MSSLGGAKRRYVAAVGLGALALASAIALLGTSGWLISRASQQPPILYLMVAMTAVRAFGIGRSLFRYAERLVSHDAVFRTLGALRVAVYRRLERLAPNGHAWLRRGDLLSRLVADVDAVHDYYLRFRLPAWSAALVCVATAGFLGWLLPGVGAVTAAGLLLAGVAVPALAAAVSRRAERRLAPARGTLATQVVDLLSGTAELTVAGALPRRLDAVRRSDRELTGLAARSATTAGLGSGLVALLTGLTVTACAALGVAATAAHHVHGVVLAVLILTPLAAFEAVAGLPVAAQVRERSKRSADRLLEVMDAPEPVREPEHPVTLDGADPLPVRVRGLTAYWPGRAEPALRDLDLDLLPGRRIAVVGPSGSGKTTLATVLLRFLEPSAGAVTLTPDQVDAANLDGDEVRRAVGLCAQDAHLFDSSLRENLRLARPGCDDGALWEALDAARLGGWARELPEGLDTMVGEHGARLSGGQRQRLALARALLADFPLLVLDEPAEHLDLATADALTADLLAATEGRATLLITHRLAGLEAVDEIVVLDRGRVVQRGGWAELVEAEGPLRRMWQRERETDELLTGVPA
jgi:ATP-binding cassette subfamily C protein CydCD